MVLYEFFYPGYRAGGPVQSLVNMVMALNDVFEFKIVTTAFDLHATQPYLNVQLNKWNEIKLYNDTTVDVWYSSVTKPSVKEMKKVIDTAKPDIIYINGFYTNHFLYPLILKKIGFLKNTILIVAPRGMLQTGALKNKSFLKKTYLQLLKLFGLMKQVDFHATTTDEAKDIENIFGRQHKITVAGNIPKKPVATIQPPVKEKGKLKLIYLSLISEKKNLLLLLEILQTTKAVIILDIYGPVKDENYWQQCFVLIQKMPANITVTYKGDIGPDKIQSLMEEYDAIILLTKGENFGHALFESLSVGRPIITSYFTPWNQLTEKLAGWNVDIEKKESVCKLLCLLAAKEQAEWGVYCNGALQLANNYYQYQSFNTAYKKLFQV